MANVNFRQGLKSQLPATAPVGDLLFTTDTGEIFKGTGDSSPLLAYGSVLYGYENLAGLIASDVKIEGKLYLTNENKLYRYNGTEFVPLSAVADNVTASEVSFVNTGTGIEGTNVQTALEELAGLVQYQDENTGKVKVNEADTLGYLEDKIDDVTIKVDADKLEAVGIKGLTLTGEEVQELLRDTTGGNIQEQIDLLSKGVVYVGRFDAVTNIPDTLDVNGNMVVIDTEGESSELFIYNEDNTTWESIGKFEFSDNFIGLKDTPAAYSSGKFVKSSATGIIFGDVDYSEILNAPDLTELEQSLEDMHTHTNKDLLDKFAEDDDGDLTYNGEKVTSSWGSFE